MATETDVDAASIRRTEVSWSNGALGGFLGTLAFGAVQYAVGAVGIIAVAIPALYGISGPNLLAGWLIHLFHGVVLGLVYAAVVSTTSLREYGTRLTGGVVLGLGYGVVTTVVLAALVMPVWLGAVGFPNAPPLPNFTVPSLVFHLVYGVVLGGTYAARTD
ncbi:MAG: histidine kinase [Haloferacaceae archaeon]